MNDTQWFWAIFATLWVLAEIALGIRKRASFRGPGAGKQISEITIWSVLGISVFFALQIKNQQWAPIAITGNSRQLIAVSLLVAGLALRLCAVMVLGRWFSTRVQLLQDHELVTTGPYRFIRHPAYCGLLISFFGAGMAMGDWLAVLFLIFPIVWVLISRMELEEALLISYFGDAYLAYQKRSRKLFPFLY